MTWELHPWSEGFTWKDHAGPFQFLTPDQVAEFDAQGFITVPELFGAGEVERIAAEIDVFDAELNARLAATGNVGISQKGAITVAHNLVARSPVMRGFVRHPALLAIASDLLGPDVDLYWDQAVCKRSERPQRFPLHQDTGYQFTVPEDFVSCWIAVTEASQENGCLLLAPGMHRNGTLRHVHTEPQGWEECLVNDPPDLVPAPLPPGGAVIFSSLTPHTTGANNTGTIRKAYLVLYTRPGTVAYIGPPDGPRPAPQPQNDPCFHFPVVRGGRPVS
jgi:phytanoyl-CoA hydroxylase